MNIESSTASLSISPEEDVNPELEAIQAKQGKVTGIIIPPPEIRAVADKTAQFVARNGKSFEQKILSSGEGQTAKFNFMKPFDPYHAYYEFKIREFEETIANGGTIKPTTTTQPQVSAIPSTTAVSVTSAPMATTVTTIARATLTSPIAKFAMSKPSSSSSSDSAPFQPSAYEFSLGSPAGLSMLDMDVIKLTAQYTAANGRDFLAGLAQREARNPQFDFLKPTHLLFSYFTSLVDAYAKVLHPNVLLKEKLKKTCQKMIALELAVNRWKFNKDEIESKRKENTDVSQEKVAFSNIDWFDFVVVETIDFPSEELVEYGNMSSGVNKMLLGVGNTGGISSSSIISSSSSSSSSSSNGIVNTATTAAASETRPTAKTAVMTVKDEDEDMDMDMEESDEEEDADKYKPKPPLPPSSVSSSVMAGISSSSSSSSSRGYLDTDDDDNEYSNHQRQLQLTESHIEDEEEDDDAALKVVSDYRPRMAPSAVSSATSGTAGIPGGGMTMLDPLSGRMIPVNEMSEHMRVALLDPKWRVEQQRFQEKQKETGFAEGSSIADSLKQFAKRRSDIFGGSAGSGGSGVGGSANEADRARQLEEDEKERERVQWDGHQGSIAQAQQLQRDLMRRTPATSMTAVSAVSSKPAIGPSLPGADLSSITILSSSSTSLPSVVTPVPATVAAPPIKAVSIVSPKTVAPIAPIPLPPVVATTPVTAILPPTPIHVAVPPPPPDVITTAAMTALPPAPFPLPLVPMAIPPIPLAPSAMLLPPVPVSIASMSAVSLPLPPPPIPTQPPATTFIQAPTTAVTQAPAKKSRTTADVSEVLVPAEEFAATHTGPVTLQVVVPPDATAQGKSWGFISGTSQQPQQVVSVTVESVNSTVKSVKDLIAQKIKESGSGSDSIPVSRFQLKVINSSSRSGAVLKGVFLKDANTLATHNIGDDSFVLELSIKSRR